MIVLRGLLIGAAVAVVICVAGYLLSGDRRWLRRALRSLGFSALAALLFFAILIVERLAA